MEKTAKKVAKRHYENETNDGNDIIPARKRKHITQDELHKMIKPELKGKKRN